MKKLFLLCLILMCSNAFGQGYPAYRPKKPMSSDGSNAADLVSLPNRVRAVFASITQDLDVGGDLEVAGELRATNASFSGAVEVAGKFTHGGNVHYLTPTDNINAFIASTVVENGDVVELAAGTYTVTASIAIAKSIHLRGQGLARQRSHALPARRWRYPPMA